LIYFRPLLQLAYNFYDCNLRDSGEYPAIKVQETLLLLQIPVLIIGLVFLNRNKWITVACTVVYVGLLVATLVNCLQSTVPACEHYWGWDSLAWVEDYRYFRMVMKRIVECSLLIGALYGIQQVKQPLAISCSVLLIAWNAVWAYCLEMGSEVIAPLFLLICAIWPRSIRTMLQVISCYLALRFMAFVTVELIMGYSEGSFPCYMVFPEYMWILLITIFWLNGLLSKPVPFKTFAKIFGLTFIFFIAVYFLGSMLEEIQGKSKNNKVNQEKQRKVFLEETRNNIESWKKAGYSDSFTTDAAKSMLFEGKISPKEYRWLLNEMAKNA